MVEIQHPAGTGRPSEGTYVFDDTWEQERNRLTSLQAALDPGTERLLRDLGVGDGWRCLEVGAGAGSVAAWLCEHVGVRGVVVASDIQTKFLEPLRHQHANLEILRHDVTTEDLPPDHFDLVHVRWALHWPAARVTAIQRLVSSLRPGGWLLAEEPDFVTLLEGCASECLRKVLMAGVRRIEARSGGMDSHYGRNLAGDLARQGLVNVGVEGRLHLIRGADQASGAEWLRFTIEKVRDELSESGIVTTSEIEEALRLLGHPTFATMSPLTVAAWGQRRG